MRSASVLMTRLASVVWPFASAIAQEGASTAAPDAPPAASQEEGASVLESIVVTARKRDERLQDVPIAISAVSAEEMSARGGIDIQQVAKVSPGVYYQAGDRRAPTLFIRGIGTRSFTDEADASIGTFIDGVYIARFNSQLQDIFDVERVEVLKGPQGSLFGRNTIGGAINIVTVAPSDHLQAKATSSYGWNEDASGHEISVGALVGGPLIQDKLLGQISASFSDIEGATDIVNTGERAGGGRNTTIRGKLVTDASDDLKLSLIADYYESKDELPGYRSNDAGGLRSPILLARPGAVSPVDPDPYRITATPGIPLPTRSGGGLNLTSTFSSDAFNITSITAYRESDLDNTLDFDGTSLAIWEILTRSRQDQFSEEIRFSSTEGGALTLGDRVAWTLGAYFFSESVEQNYAYGFGADSAVVALPPPSGTGGQPILYTSDARIDVDSYAFFGQATIDITDALSLDLGARYTTDKKTYVVDVETSAPTVYRSSFIQPAHNTWSSFDPTAILSYKVVPSVLTYVSYSKGFKSGAYQLAPATPLLASQAAKPEELDAYQGGIKAELLDDTLRLNFAGFYYKYENIQVQRTVLLPGQTTTTSLLTNGAQSTLKGFELDGQYAFADHWRAEFGYSYVDARYDRYDFTPTVSFSGNHLPRAPENSGNISLIADYPLGSGELTLRASGNYVSSYYFEPSNDDAGVREPSHTTADFSADFSFDRYSVGLFGKNITNEKQRAYLVNINPTRLLEIWAPGRVVGVRFSAQW